MLLPVVTARSTAAPSDSDSGASSASAHTAGYTGAVIDLSDRDRRRGRARTRLTYPQLRKLTSLCTALSTGDTWCAYIVPGPSPSDRRRVQTNEVINSRYANGQGSQETAMPSSRLLRVHGVPLDTCKRLRLSQQILIRLRPARRDVVGHTHKERDSMIGDAGRRPVHGGSRSSCSPKQSPLDSFDK
jgi:hypothetical protein